MNYTTRPAYYIVAEPALDPALGAACAWTHRKAAITRRYTAAPAAC